MLENNKDNNLNLCKLCKNDTCNDLCDKCKLTIEKSKQMVTVIGSLTSDEIMINLLQNINIKLDELIKLLSKKDKKTLLG